MQCLCCKKKLSFANRILNGAFCGDGHRDSFLEALNRLGLARLSEARPSMPRAAWSDDLLRLQEQLCAEPANGNRVLKRLKSESTQLIHDLALPSLEYEQHVA
jgi:hypothetical protein